MGDRRAGEAKVRAAGKQLTEIRRGGFLGQEAPRLPQWWGWWRRLVQSLSLTSWGCRPQCRLSATTPPKDTDRDPRASDADTVTLHHRAGRKMDF